jgi:hypothetical protein
MARSNLLYKVILEDLSPSCERCVGRGRLLIPNGSILPVKYECDFCSRKNLWEGIISGNLTKIDRQFLYELKLLIAGEDVIDCLITTYSTTIASFTGQIRPLESERDAEAIRAGKVWLRVCRGAERRAKVQL